MHIKNQRRTVAAALVLASAGLALAPAADGQPAAGSGVMLTLSKSRFS